MMHKKGPKDDMRNYRAICLLPHAYKVLSMCLLQRILPHIEPGLPDTQAGFRPARGCRDNTCVLAWTVDWLLEHGRPAVLTCIDFKAAFDSVGHSFLISVLRSYGCPEKYVRIVALMYETANVTLRLQLRGGMRVYSRHVPVRRDVLQGDILSPLCFVTALDWIFRRYNLRNAGIILPNALRMDKLEYADDIGLLDETPSSTGCESWKLTSASPGAS